MSIELAPPAAFSFVAGQYLKLNVAAIAQHEWSAPPRCGVPRYSPVTPDKPLDTFTLSSHLLLLFFFRAVWPGLGHMLTA